MKTPARILAIGAHPDDIELGCGGSIAKLIRQGAHVRTLVLSQGHRGADSKFDRISETNEALRLLGVEDLHFAELTDTRMHDHFNELITLIEQHVKEFNPDRVYTMFEHDRHQDHRTVFEATIVACRGVRQILSYETPSSWPNFNPVVFEELAQEDMDVKIDALKCHLSQAYRDYTQRGHLSVSANFRGQQIGLGMAEGFIPYKFVL